MSDSTPLVQAKPGLALLFLVLSFSAGLLLVYSRGSDQQPIALPAESGGGHTAQSSKPAGGSATGSELDAALEAVRVQLVDAQTRILKLEQALATMRARARAETTNGSPAVGDAPDS